MAYTITSNEDVTDNKVVVWKQFLISLFASLPFFTHGIENDLLSVTAHLAPPIEPLDVPWTTVAFIITSLVTAPVHGLIINRHGRRTGIYILVLLQGMTSVPLLFSTTEVSVLVHAAVAGAATGGLFVIIPIYVREISADGIRGVTVSFMVLMTSAGNAMKLLLTFDQLLFLVIGLVAIQLLIIFLIPESPGYLVKANKLEEAKVAAADLVRLKSDDTFVVDEVQKLKEESERAKANGQITIFKIFTSKIYRDEMKIGFFLNTTTILSGCIIFLDQDKTLSQLRTDIDPQKILVPFSLLLGACITAALVKFIERRYLLTIAYSTMVLSMGTLAVYTQADLTVTSLRWVPVATLAVLVVGYGMLWALPTLIMVEMLNLEIRATALVVVYVYSQILKLVHTLTFQYVEEYVGVYTLLYMFAGVNMLGAIYSVSTPPDVRDKTVRQIERQMRRVPLWKL